MSDQADQLRKQLPSQAIVLPTGLALGGVGWIGLALVVFLTVPTLGPRWLLFFLTTLAFSGPALPVVNYLHRRFPSNPPANGGVLVREALLVGAYVDILLWLQFGKALNFALGAFIAVGVVAVEVLLRWIERTKWVPPAEE
jgi:hypothetical protein